MHAPVPPSPPGDCASRINPATSGDTTPALESTEPTHREIAEIINLVAACWGYLYSDLCSYRRPADLVQARHAAYTLLAWRGMTRSAIGRTMNRRHHSGISHGICALSDAMDTVPGLRHLVHRLARSLRIMHPGGWS